MSVNKLTLIGNVGDEPRVKSYDDGSKCAVVRLATTERAYTRQDGQQAPERTEWHTLVFWRRLADTVQQYVHKGDKLYIEGKLKSREYADKNYPDVKHKAWDVEVSVLEMLTPKAQGSAPMPASPVPQPMRPMQPMQPMQPAPLPQQNYTYQQAEQAVAATQAYLSRQTPQPMQSQTIPQPQPAPVPPQQGQMFGAEQGDELPF